MYLRQIQTRPPEGMMKIAFGKMHEAGQEVPEIMHLFRFKQRSTDHLVRFTEEVMRGPSPLSQGLRELIGAFISSRNQCRFCSCAHAPVAAALLGEELVQEVLVDFETSRLDARHKELFRYVARLGENPALIDAADITRLKHVGWSEEAIYDALTVTAMFKFYNTWNSGSGVKEMRSTDYLHSGNRLMTLGYCMDFGPKALLKVLWVGRKEITCHDLKELMKILLSKLMNVLTVRKKSLSDSGAGRVEPAPATTACPLEAAAEQRRLKEGGLGVSLAESGDPAA